MAFLDDLSGFEFEDVIEDVFRNLGYENVRQAERTADEGRDSLMEEVVDGTPRECYDSVRLRSYSQRAISTSRGRRSFCSASSRTWSM